MVQEDVYQRIATLESKVNEHGRKLEKQEEKNETQIEIHTILKMQVETNKEQSKQMIKFGETLDKVNENLTGLNTGMQDLNNRVTEIENNQESKKIDLAVLAKTIIFKVVPTVIGAWILFYFGWK